MTLRLQPKFSCSDLPALVEAYDPKLDNVALAAGAAIRKGQYTRENLLAIFDWKTKRRGRSRLSANTDEEIADALHIAVSARTERAATSVLLGLHGVNVPVASAFLAAINPERYMVIDYRALEALGFRGSRYYSSVRFYLAYLNTCRSIARSWKVRLRDLDRALWQWSKSRKRP